MKAEVTIKVSPTELQILKQALFVYEHVLKSCGDLTNRRTLSLVEERYGDNLTDLPISLQIAVRKVRNGLH